MNFLFPRWDMLIPWRVPRSQSHSSTHPNAPIEVTLSCCSQLPVFGRHCCWIRNEIGGFVHAKTPGVLCRMRYVKASVLQISCWATLCLCSKNEHKCLIETLIFAVVFGFVWLTYYQVRVKFILLPSSANKPSVGPFQGCIEIHCDKLWCLERWCSWLRCYKTNKIKNWGIHTKGIQNNCWGAFFSSKGLQNWLALVGNEGSFIPIMYSFIPSFPTKGQPEKGWKFRAGRGYPPLDRSMGFTSWDMFWKP